MMSLTNRWWVICRPGPEVNNGLRIDNDVSPTIPGSFEATIAFGNQIPVGDNSNVTVEDARTGEILIGQDYVFLYNTYIQVGNTVTSLADATVTQQATLIANDVVESRGSFAGPNGVINFVATSSFANGFSTLQSRVDFDGGTTALGDIRVITYLDEDVEQLDDDILVTAGTPGQNDFRAYTLDGQRRRRFRPRRDSWSRTVRIWPARPTPVGRPMSFANCSTGSKTDQANSPFRAPSILASLPQSPES